MIPPLHQLTLPTMLAATSERGNQVNLGMVTRSPNRAAAGGGTILSISANSPGVGSHSPAADEQFAEHELRAAIHAVRVRSVEERDASVDRRIDHGTRGVDEAAAEVVAAEADDRYEQSGVTECSI
jgi:hypothetical protein